MRKSESHLYPLIFLLMISLSCNVRKESPSEILAIPIGNNESSLYFGQSRPGVNPEKFAPGIISTDKDEVNSIFHPGGNEFYYSVFHPGEGYRIMVMRKTKKNWLMPPVSLFVGGYSEVDPFIDPSGRRLFFCSKRPAWPEEKASPGYQIWISERNKDDWSRPEIAGKNLNIGSRQLYPTVTLNNTVYFNSDINGNGDFFMSSYDGEEYMLASELGDSINTEYDETDIYVSPDESFAVFTSVDRPDGFGGGDLYVSFKRKDGLWMKAINLGETINTKSSEFSPVVSTDGKYLFFTSGRQGSTDIYWVDADVIKKYKPL
jgi:hypothetical protein